MFHAQFLNLGKDIQLAAGTLKINASALAKFENLKIRALAFSPPVVLN